MKIDDIGPHLTDEELLRKNRFPWEEEEIARHLERCVRCSLRRSSLRWAETRRMIAENEELLAQRRRNK